MPAIDRRQVRVCARACLCALFGLAGAAPVSAAEAVTYEFAVLFDGKRIGSHVYEVIRAPDATRVRSDAAFKVKVLFVTAYRYRHQANELWQDGCLTALASATDDNGERFEVRVRRQPDGLRLTAQGPGQEAAERTRLLDSGCPTSFAYWDRARLERDTLINAQTGDSVDSSLTFEDMDTVDGTVARRYRLDPEGMASIRLWYRESDEQWLRLETRRDDALLAYELERAERRTVSGVDEDAGVEDPVGI